MGVNLSKDCIDCNKCIDCIKCKKWNKYYIDEYNLRHKRKILYSTSEFKKLKSRQVRFRNPELCYNCSDESIEELNNKMY